MINIILLTLAYIAIGVVVNAVYQCKFSRYGPDYNRSENGSAIVIWPLLIIAWVFNLVIGWPVTLSMWLAHKCYYDKNGNRRSSKGE